MIVKVKLISFFSFSIMVSGVIGQFCAGCFKPVTTDWHTNPTLVKVVEKAVTGTRQYLMATQSQLFGSSDLKLDKIDNFQSQVVAGTNYCLTIIFKSGEGANYQCTGV